MNDKRGLFGEEKKPPKNPFGGCRDKVVETKRIELSTSRMRTERSPS